MGSNIRQLDLNDSSPLSDAINNMPAKQQPEQANSDRLVPDKSEKTTNLDTLIQLNSNKIDIPINSNLYIYILLGVFGLIIFGLIIYILINKK
jgi:hypothetical protein